jgi:hypothetical protein
VTYLYAHHLSPSPPGRLISPCPIRTPHPTATQAFGSTLLAHLRATVAQLAHGTPNAGLRSAAADRLVFYAGHDINLFFLRNFFRLNWQLNGYNKNQAALGGMLQLELYSVAGEEGSIRFLRVFYVGQSYGQQRNSETLSKAANPPRKVFVAIPECSGGPEGACGIDQFLALCEKELDPRCVVQAELLPAAAASGGDGSGTFSSSTLVGSSVGSGAVGVAAACAFFLTKRRGSSKESGPERVGQLTEQLLDDDVTAGGGTHL